MRIAERRECDVLVCGGGTAGLGAALAAARLGRKTILLERHGYCGGICVSSLVHTFDGARSCRDHGQFVVGGIPREVIRRLAAVGGLALQDNPPETLNFDPETMKAVGDRLLGEAGVTVLYHLLNLLVAGRCLSATHEAHGSTRVGGTAMATGEAAGTLAALAAGRGCELREVPYDELAAQLTRQGAILSL